MKIEHIFGKVLKLERAKKNISQEELAFKSNLDRTYISMLERGIHQPTLSSILSISKALDLKASELVNLCEIEIGKAGNNE